MTSIKREDIQVGDTIKATTVLGGALVERSGKVYSITPSMRTEEGGNLWDSGWDGQWTFELIDRPKPKLPTVPGSVIIATNLEYRKAALDAAVNWAHTASEPTSAQTIVKAADIFEDYLRNGKP